MIEYARLRGRVLKKERNIRRCLASVRKISFVFWVGFIFFLLLNYRETDWRVLAMVLILAVLSGMRAGWLLVGDIITNIFLANAWDEVSVAWSHISEDEKLSMSNSECLRWSLRDKAISIDLVEWMARPITVYWDNGTLRLIDWKGDDLIFSTTVEIEPEQFCNGQTYYFDSTSKFCYENPRILERPEEPGVLKWGVDRAEAEHTLFFKGLPAGIIVVIDIRASLEEKGDIYYNGALINALFVTRQIMREEIR